MRPRLALLLDLAWMLTIGAVWAFLLLSWFLPDLEPVTPEVAP